MLDRAISLRGRGSYVLQAAIASLQAEAEIDWPQVEALYGELARITGSPVVKLNRAAAVGESRGPEDALPLVEELNSELDDYTYLHSTRAVLLMRLGRTEDARLAYSRALELAGSEAERRFLNERLDEL